MGSRAALLFITVAFVLSSGLAHASDPITAGYRDFNFGSTVINTPTGEKPESKVWWADGFWWGCFWDDVSSRYEIYQLDLPTQCWVATDVPVDDRSNSKADALWDGTKLYIVSHVFTNTAGPTSASQSGRIYRYSYNTSTDTYTLDTNFPTEVNGSKSETLVMEKDSTGQLWVTWKESGKVKINRTTTADHLWGTPFNLPVQGNDADADDISSIVAFGGDKIGVMWSNQDDQKMYFAVHEDSKGDTDWEPREDAVADAGLGQVADDHINLAAFGDEVFAATKTGLGGSNPLNYLSKRSASGVWTNYQFGTVAEDHTRPIVVLDPGGDTVYMFASSDITGKKIMYMKSTSMSAPSFVNGLGTAIIESSTDLEVNNVTSTKQALDSNTGLLIAASDKDSHFYLHNYFNLLDGAPLISSFTPTGGPVGTEVTITGVNYTGVTEVAFDGTPATSYTVDSATQIRADVPTGATTGKISVTNGAGTGFSNNDFTVVDIPTVASFTPSSGSPGTEVTITGTHFSMATDVAFNGASAASFIIDSDTQIRADVPSAATTGKISVTNPAGTGLSATDFTVQHQLPTIASFTPSSGPPATEVTITGTNYTGITEVAFNGTPADSFIADSSTQIRAWVASGSTTGKISVTNPAGTALSDDEFTVLPGPSMVTVNPIDDAYVRSSDPDANFGSWSYIRVQFGGASDYNSYLKFEVTGLTDPVQSATLRLYVQDASSDGGSFYTVSNDYQSTSTPWDEDGITWNNAPTISGAPLGSLGTTVVDTWVEVDVTSAVTGNGIFSFGANSTTSNSARYNSTEGANPPELVIVTLANPSPVITDFSPVTGPIGAEVTIEGINFSGATEIAFNGAPADSFTVDADTLATAFVPAAASTGQISLTTPGGTALSDSVFTFIPAPVISSFTPESGPIGAEVTIEGINFSGATEIAFNGTPADSFTVDADTLATAFVPAGASTGQISLTTPGGTAVSDSTFTVIDAPIIASFTPESGPVGTEVTIEGIHFSGATEIAFNGTPADSFTVDADTLATAFVPAGASTGQISLTTPGGTAVSDSTFTVIPAPVISSFTPESGPIGAEVTIEGINFSGATEIAFNGAPADSFTVDADTLATAFVPAGASTGQISLTTPGGTALSDSVFTFIPPPVITDFSPVTGPVGAEVTIEGINFSGATEIAFNGAPADSFTVDADTLATAFVPAGASTGQISLTTPGGTAVSDSTFTFIPAPVIASFTPESGPVGTEVTIEGINFSGATEIAFNGAPADSFTVDADTLATAFVPAGASTGQISLTTPGGTAVSDSTFSVIDAPIISGFTPESGPIGAEVTIEGVNFSGATEIAFGGAPADSFTVDADTLATAFVPGGATTGQISLTTVGGTAISDSVFTVIPAPVVSSFTPQTGPIGTEVTIEGINFSGATEIAFNGTPADSFTVDADTLATAFVPAGATTGKISITTPGGTGSSNDDFVMPDASVFVHYTEITSDSPTGVPVSYSGSDSLGAVSVVLDYDDTKITFEGVQTFVPGETFSGGIVGGQISIQWFDETGGSDPIIPGVDPDTLFAVLFTSNVASDTTQITVDENQSTLGDKTGDPIPNVGWADTPPFGQVVLDVGLDVSGRVGYYALDKDVPDALLSMGPPNPDVTTDSGGNYAFAPYQTGNYTLDIDKTNDLGGLNSLDGIKVIRHSTGQEPFDDPYELVAADVNIDSLINSLDAIKIVRRALELEALPSGDWVFDPEMVMFEPLQTDSVANFVAVRMGDVNGSWTSSSMSMAEVSGKTTEGGSQGVAGNTVSLAFQDTIVDPAASPVELPLLVTAFDSVGAISLRITFEDSVLSFVDVVSKVEGVDFVSNTVGNQIGIEWFDNTGGNAPIVIGADTLLCVVFDLIGAVGESSPLHFTEESVIGDAVGDPIPNVSFIDGSATLATSVSIQPADTVIPRAYALHHNRPNPFNPYTSIRFDLPHPSHVKMTVYTVAGREVATLVNRRLSAGIHNVEWDGRDHSGRQLTSGVYIYAIRADDFFARRKMVLLR